MQILRNISIGLYILASIGVNELVAQGKLKVICKTEVVSPRISYAAEQVREACEEFSLKATLKIDIQDQGEEEKLKPEGFHLKSLKKNVVEVVGADESGVLYGCLELADRMRDIRAIPANPIDWKGVFNDINTQQ